MTVAEVGGMTAAEWAGWQAYVRLEDTHRKRAELRRAAQGNARQRTVRMRRRGR